MKVSFFFVYQSMIVPLSSLPTCSWYISLAVLLYRTWLYHLIASYWRIDIDTNGTHKHTQRILFFFWFCSFKPVSVTTFLIFKIRACWKLVWNVLKRYSVKMLVLLFFSSLPIKLSGSEDDFHTWCCVCLCMYNTPADPMTHHLEKYGIFMNGMCTAFMLMVSF